MLGVALVVGLLMASPQLWLACRYYPSSVRATQTAQEKQALGSLPWPTLLKRMVSLQRLEWVDGVAPSETQCYPGMVLLLGVLLAPLSWWHGVLLLSSLLAMGRYTPLFDWTARLHLRIPARYSYLVNLSLLMLGLSGWASRSLTSHGLVVLLLAAWELLVRFPSLSPTTPYCQRWMKPSDALVMPIAQFLQTHLREARVSGLPYPHRTGLLGQFRTLGYNGASQPQWMASLRPGEGGHDGVASDAPLTVFGVKYAYTLRPLHVPQWRPTFMPHLYRNAQVCRPVLTWQALAHERHLRPA